MLFRVSRCGLVLKICGYFQMFGLLTTPRRLKEVCDNNREKTKLPVFFFVKLWHVLSFRVLHVHGFEFISVVVIFVSLLFFLIWGKLLIQCYKPFNLSNWLLNVGFFFPLKDKSSELISIAQMTERSLIRDSFTITTGFRRTSERPLTTICITSVETRGQESFKRFL